MVSVPNPPGLRPCEYEAYMLRVSVGCHCRVAFGVMYESLRVYSLRPICAGGAKVRGRPGCTAYGMFAALRQSPVAPQMITVPGPWLPAVVGPLTLLSSST